MSEHCNVNISKLTDFQKKIGVNLLIQHISKVIQKRIRIYKIEINELSGIKVMFETIELHKSLNGKEILEPIGSMQPKYNKYFINCIKLSQKLASEYYKNNWISDNEIEDFITNNQIKCFAYLRD